jgi:ElaB/YqjD/DUF883 family membrane-anchored ribosome-binding protein
MAAGINNEEMVAGVKTLKSDIIRLNDDFNRVVHSVGEQSREKFIESKRRFAGTLNAFYKNTTEKVSDARQRISERGKEVVEKSRKGIVARPLTSLVTALGAGMLAGALIKRR